MLTFLIFIGILALLVLVHEAGHFWVARRAGVKVEEFGFGFPPRIFGFKKGDTIYSLNLIPLGGFVKIFGEEGEGQGDSTSFASQKAGVRAKIIVAGVVMNFLLAIVLLSLGNYLGLPTIIEDNPSTSLGVNQRDVKIQITGIAPHSPAEQSKLQLGDTIKNFSSVTDIQNFVSQHKGEEIILEIQRGNETLEKKITPRIDYPNNEGPMGINLAKTAIVSYPWYQAIYFGTKSAVELAGFFLYSFYQIIKNLIFHNVLIGDVAGPVGIIALTAQAAKLGFIYILQFAAILSINLALINAFPFPALDGGRLLFILIEKIKGSPVPQRIEKIIHTTGFILLLFLMLLVTIRDVHKFF